jgi:low affinity Fe/Cu permease
LISATEAGAPRAKKRKEWLPPPQLKSLRWGISGPFFGFSDTWQLVINTGTTIVTFLMVFLIQNSQNRDSAAIQVKLDELIRVSKANNSFMGLEHLTDEELQEIEGKCEGRAKAVLEARTASEDAKLKLRVIDGDG